MVADPDRDVWVLRLWVHALHLAPTCPHGQLEGRGLNCRVVFFPRWFCQVRQHSAQLRDDVWWMTVTFKRSQPKALKTPAMNFSFCDVCWLALTIGSVAPSASYYDRKQRSAYNPSQTFECIYFTIAKYNQQSYVNQPTVANFQQRVLRVLKSSILLPLSSVSGISSQIVYFVKNF